MKTVMHILIFVLVVCFVWVILSAFSPIASEFSYGVTFSSWYAKKFEGVDWKQMYLAMLDDLGARNIRLVAYWEDIEATNGTYNFSDLDFEMQEATVRGARVVLVVGQKVPRWPECHIPAWANALSDTDRDERALSFIGAVVERYKNNSALSVWQVENEPFLPYGECPTFSDGYIDRAIGVVRDNDTHPVMVTDSGELSLWTQAASRSDIFGTSLYRTIWKEQIGTFSYPIPPSFFRVKRTLTQLFTGVRPMIIIELQAESWAHHAAYEISADEAYLTMNPKIFQTTLSYAKKTGFDTFYFWGVEWWYWLKTTQQHPEMWDVVKDLLVNTPQ